MKRELVITYRKPLSLSDTIKQAKAARKEGRDDISVELLVAGYKRVKTSSILLVDLANHRIQEGSFKEADTLIKRALILNPSYQPAVEAYLKLHRASKSTSALNWKFLNRFIDDTQLVWAFCKECKTESDLDGIFAALAPDGVLPAKFIRPFGNAALRAECFDLGRAQFMRAIQNATEKLPKTVKAAKSIGEAGTEALLDIVKLLNDASIPNFAAAGTCLGIVREGRPLPFDNDIDIGIMEEDFDQAKLIALTDESPLFTSSIPHPRSPKVGLKHVNGAEIDLFKFYKEKGMIWHNGVFVRWCNKPFALETKILDGVEIRIPAGHDYLVENYGVNWDTPDPLFNAFLNGPNREVIWEEYYAAHMLRTINLTIRQGNLEKAANFMRDGIEGPHLTLLEKDILRIIAQQLEDEVLSRRNIQTKA